MMATRWRETGEVQLSVGVRILHGGAEPWGIVGWRIADSSFPPRVRTFAASPEATIAPLKPLKTCRDGRLPHVRSGVLRASDRGPGATALEPGAALEITILTQAGDAPSIRFPAAILAELRRALGTQQTSLTEP